MAIYDWDPEKAAENRRKHGVDFVDAIAAIEDPIRVEEMDVRFDYPEERLRILGMALGGVLLVITTTRRRRLPHHLGAEGDTT